MSKLAITAETAIIGGGLAGLTAAALLARAGTKVAVFEKARAAGGRATTETNNGFQFNLGPHALYRTSAGARILRELGVEYRGKVPPLSGAFALSGGQKVTFPNGIASLLTTSLLTLPAKLEAARLLAGIGKISTPQLQTVTVNDWLQQEVRYEGVRQLMCALIRVTSYANSPEQQSAGAAIEQLQLGLGGGVLYLDGGWQTLVNGLRAAAEKSGAQILTETRIASVERIADGWLVQADDSFITAKSVILTIAPGDAHTLLRGAGKAVLNEWAKAARPALVACLDVALRRSPQPRALFALGFDQPLYFSVHSATAKLAPQEGALIHAAKYLGAKPAADPKAVEAELERTFDLMQPGWRELIVQQRFLPKMVASNSIVTAAQGGLAGRPGVAVPDCEDLYVAGDWVGNEGLLADASLASARQATELILQKRKRRAVAA